jgi:cytohesin
MAILLLGNGADLHVRNPETGQTPLHEAATKGHAEVVALLLDRGCDSAVKDNQGATALDEAIRFRHTKVVEVMLARGAKGGGVQSPIRQVQEAVMRGQADLVSLLLSQGADVNQKLPGGGTLLHDAALKGHAQVAEILIAKGADVNARNATGGTPLHDAALSGQKNAARVLLDHGADPNATDTDSGATPLHMAAGWNRASVVELLLERGAQQNRKTKAGKTAWELAKDAGAEGVLKLLKAPASGHQK